MLNCLKTLCKEWTPEKTRWLLGGLGVALILVLVVVFSWVGWISWRGVWKWLSGDESGSTTIRNLGLVIGGFIAIWLTLRRIRAADRQAQTAQRGLMNERYQKATEMLGSDVLSVRLGGIYALQRLAEEDPEQYHVQIMRLLCAFVRNPVKDEEVDKENQAKPLLREDVQTIMDVIATRSGADIELEKKANFKPQLTGADLRGGVFAGGNLSSVDLSGAILSGKILDFVNYGTHLSSVFLPPGMTTFDDVNLSDALFINANLSGLFFMRVNLSDAVFIDANLSGTRLSSAIGLTQVQLHPARADPENPPALGRASDPNTGKPLVWNGKPL